MLFRKFNILILILLINICNLEHIGYIGSNCRRSRDISYPQGFLSFINSVGRQSAQLAEMFQVEWSNHIDNIRRLIMQGAQGIDANRVLVIGAGNCTDIPLEALAQFFQEVVLQDFDLTGIRNAKNVLPIELQNRISLNAEDISSIGALFLNEALAIIDNAKSDSAAVRELISYMDNMELPQWNISDSEKADYIVYSLVLSVLMWGEFLYIEQRVADKFDELETIHILNYNWEEAKARFKNRVIDNVIDRLESTLNPGGRLLFIDSTIKRTTANNVSGILEDIQVFSKKHLRDLIEGRFYVDYEESWSWHYLPRDNNFDIISEHDIEALILSLP